jgi:uncharacterized membrane protein
MEGDNTSGLYSLFALMLLLIVIYVIASFWSKVIKEKDLKSHDEFIKRVYSGVVSSAGMMIWPLVWTTAIGKDNFKNMISISPGLMWPIVMGMVDMQKILATQQQKEESSVDPLEVQNQKDANSIIAMVFALGIFTSAHMETQETKRQIVPLLLLSLIMCVAFVIPSFGFDPNSKQQTIFRSIQKVGLNWSTGFIITSIIELLVFKNQTRWNK